MLRVDDVALPHIRALLRQFGLLLEVESDADAISSSFWGDSEAGIVGRTVFVRSDTPMHSLLHEACHLICMTENRRSNLDRDAGGSDLEEAAVCYLQILLADEIDGVGRDRMMRDMDAWGYSFRLGSSKRWFAGDAEDAAAWLLKNGLISDPQTTTFSLRGSV